MFRTKNNRKVLDNHEAQVNCLLLLREEPIHPPPLHDTTHKGTQLLASVRAMQHPATPYNSAQGMTKTQV